MHYITDVDRLMFAYERLGDGQELDWRGFWEGRISCKRAFLLRHALHDQRLVYSIDIEMGWRLAPAGHARRLRRRGPQLHGASDRLRRVLPPDRGEGSGPRPDRRAARGTEIAERLHVEDAAKIWDEPGAEEPRLRRRVAELEAPRRAASPRCSRTCTRPTGGCSACCTPRAPPRTGEETRHVTEPPTTVQPFPNTDPELAYDATPEDAAGRAAAQHHACRCGAAPRSSRRWRSGPWSASGRSRASRPRSSSSTTARPTRAASPRRCTATRRTRASPPDGTPASAVARAPMVVVLNSDCRVEPGWDDALYEAASDGRRVAFPYTDHCDGQGFTSPDQGGTAGWCFMMRRGLYDEIGVFDEWFNPAYCEDTDYWHRAWQAGVDLAPVPAARASCTRAGRRRSTDARGRAPAPGPPLQVRLEARRRPAPRAAVLRPRHRRVRRLLPRPGARPGPRPRPAADLRHRPQQDGDDVTARGVRRSSATTASTGADRRCGASSRSHSPRARRC